MTMTVEIYTIGHSTQPGEAFIGLLRRHGVTAVADVRTQPYSRRNPQFSRERLQAALKETGIRYVFLGRELGARTEDPACYVGDCVQFPLLAQTALFQSGIERVLEGAAAYRVALMCAEKEPLECHRTLLVARALAQRGAHIQHILIDGRLEPHEDTLARLVKQLRLPGGDDLFGSGDARIEEAYTRQSSRIAYRRPEPPK
jgi:uncharacterized protein (DUF488 family)